MMIPKEELLENALGRPPKVPWLTEFPSAKKWTAFLREVERLDPEAYDLLRFVLESGIRLLHRDLEQSRGGGKQ